MSAVTWQQIEGECGNYRDGFVTVFRKYEGQPTDEKDKQGRTVKVTVNSFARHVGIPEATFKGWVNKAKRAFQPEDRTRVNRVHVQRARQAIKGDTVPVDDKVGMLNDLISDPKVMKAWRDERAPKVNEHDRKAARASTDALFQPLDTALTRLQVPMWVDQIEKIASELSQCELPKQDITKLHRAARALMDEVEVQQFRLGMEVTQ